MQQHPARAAVQQGPSASGNGEAPRQRFGSQRGDGIPRKGPRENGERKGAAGFVFKIHVGGRPDLPRAESIIPSRAGSKELTRSRNRQQDVVESPKYCWRRFLKQQKPVQTPDFHSHRKWGMRYCSKAEQRQNAAKFSVGFFF